jgi:hypothetical protein
MRSYGYRLVIAAVWFAVGCAPSATPPAPPADTPSAIAPVEPATPAVAEPDTPFTLEDGFRLLSFGDFDAFDADDTTWSATDDGLHCTGKPRGYLYSKDSFQNFTLRLEYRFPRPDKLTDETKFKGNTGFLIYISGEHKLWPVCLEVQGKHVQMGAVKENGGAQAPEVVDDDAARQQARKPVGQWNQLEIVSRDGALTVLLNGQEVARSQPAFLSSGPLGIQAEDHPFDVRRLRVRVDQ